MPRRVCVVVTARPSYSRIKSALVALATTPGVELQIVACASALVTRYGCVADTIREDGFQIAAEVHSVLDGAGLQESAVSTGILLTQLPGVLARLKPDVVVTIADRHETLATAIAASYQNIPLCHIQGGEVSGSIDDKVRKAVTELADLHLVATDLAGQRVAEINASADYRREIMVTGCPSIDLARQAIEVGPLRGYEAVILQHAVPTEVDQAAEQIKQTIAAMRHLDVLWFWPGEDAGNAAIAKELRLAGLHPTRNLPPLLFLRTLLGSKCLVGNSSVGIRECSYLGVPVVNIGTRQQGRERGPNVVDVKHEATEIYAAWAHQVSHGRYPQSTLYGDGFAGQRIAKILARQRIEAVA